MLPNGQGALIERLGLLVFVLLCVEVGQAVEAAGSLGMIGASLLFIDGESVLIERLCFAVLPTRKKIGAQTVEKCSCFSKGERPSAYVLDCEKGLGEIALAACPRRVFVERQEVRDYTHNMFCPLSLLCFAHLALYDGLD